MRLERHFSRIHPVLLFALPVNIDLLSSRMPGCFPSNSINDYPCLNNVVLSVPVAISVIL